MAPPPRSRLPTPVSLPAPSIELQHQTRQRRPDLPADIYDNNEQIGKPVSRTTETGETGTETSNTGTETSNTDNDDEDQANNKHTKDHDDHEGKIIYILDVLLFSFFFFTVRYSEIYE